MGDQDTSLGASAGRFPPVSRLGVVMILLGALWDVVEHASVAQPGVAATPPHGAHALVLVGMVVVLAGIVLDGTRKAGRRVRQKESVRDAVR